MEMDAAAKEAEPPHMAGGVWLWLPDRGVCVRPWPCYAAAYREKNPLPDGMHDSYTTLLARERRKAAIRQLCLRFVVMGTQSRNLPKEFFSLHISPHGVRLERCGLLYRVRTG